MKIYSVLLIIIWSCTAPAAQDEVQVTDAFRLNQVGYQASGSKQAILLGNLEFQKFQVWDEVSGNLVLEKDISPKQYITLGGKTSRVLEFSELQSGAYTLRIPGVGRSFPFLVQGQVFEDLGKSALKAFFFQRASIEIEEKYAGIWARQMGHPDTQVEIHSSAATTQRPEGSILSASRGWYDAGDYNKYVVNSGITTATLMSLYEDFPGYLDQMEIQIPELGDRTPDILDEIRWNLQWMIYMQDPTDGGVYHKLTTSRFEAMDKQPHEAVSQRYVVQKSTAATLNFAAVMAQASRIYKEYAPQESVEYLKAAQKAWVWAKANPEAYYQQNKINAQYKPEIHTGAYGDSDLSDEWFWAGSELWISTHNDEYWHSISAWQGDFVLPSWSKVAGLGYLSLIRHQANLPQMPQAWIADLKSQLVGFADQRVLGSSESAYQVVMGVGDKDFVWGSNSVAANLGIILLNTYKLTSKSIYLESARSLLDYLLGKNATGYCYVTGFGTKSPQYPHHRLASSRPELPPLPGFIVGGPNPGQQDSCTYRSKVADESYTDEYCSYASNEIAINWNAPFAYLVNGLNALEK